MLVALAAAVVTRILWVRFTSRPGAGVNVAVALPPDIVADADENATQLAKLSSETWIEPEHAPAAVWPVSVAGFIAVVNVTAIDVLAMGAAPSAGVVLATCGAATQLP